MDPRPSIIAAAYPSSASVAAGIVSVADALGIDAAWLANVIQFESGWNPQARNKLSGATGLIQFMPSTAKGLGTSTDALYRMSAAQQLPYVYAYLRPYAGRMSSQEDVYMAVFYPKAIGNPDFAFPANVQRYNPGIRTPRDYARKAQTRAKIHTALGSRTATEAVQTAQRAAQVFNPLVHPVGRWTLGIATTGLAVGALYALRDWLRFRDRPKRVRVE